MDHMDPYLASSLGQEGAVVFSRCSARSSDVMEHCGVAAAVARSSNIMEVVTQVKEALRWQLSM
jgi:hypothetical protein